MSPPVFTGSRAALVPALYERGWTLAEIAREFDTWPSTVRDHLRRIGKDLRGMGPRPGHASLDGHRAKVARAEARRERLRAMLPGEVGDFDLLYPRGHKGRLRCFRDLHKIGAVRRGRVWFASEEAAREDERFVRFDCVKQERRVTT